MGWFWADTARTPGTVAPHPLPNRNATPPVRYALSLMLLYSVILTYLARLSDAYLHIVSTIISPSKCLRTTPRRLMSHKSAKRPSRGFYLTPIDFI